MEFIQDILITGMILPNNWNENGKIIEIALAFFVVLIVGSFPVSTFDVVTIVGEVNDANQIISDGEIYEVDDTQKGDDLVKS